MVLLRYVSLHWWKMAYLRVVSNFVLVFIFTGSCSGCYSACLAYSCCVLAADRSQLYLGLMLCGPEMCGHGHVRGRDADTRPQAFYGRGCIQFLMTLQTRMLLVKTNFFTETFSFSSNNYTTNFRSHLQFLHMPHWLRLPLGSSWFLSSSLLLIAVADAWWLRFTDVDATLWTRSQTQNSWIRTSLARTLNYSCVHLGLMLCVCSLSHCTRG